MSFAHFDEIYEICHGMIEMEEVLVKERPKMKMEKEMKTPLPMENKRWEEVPKESEKEKELLHV